MKRLTNKPNTNTATFWNDYYASIDIEEDRLIIYEQLEEILQNIQFNTVLEIGCGTGIGAAYLKECFPDIIYTGSDFSLMALDKAANYVDHVKLLDIRYQDPSDYYDVIIIAETLEHLENPYEIIDRCLYYCNYLVLSFPLDEPEECDPEHIWCNITPDDFSQYDVIYTKLNTSYFQIIIVK